MPGLLVSVRSAEEARAALAGGASLIDVKEPRAGAMGRASAEALAAVLDAIDSQAPVSAAMGELVEWPTGALPPELDRLAFVKWGLARAPSDWEQRLVALRETIERRSACRLVAVAYADFRRAEAPSPRTVAHGAHRALASGLLLDTWHKDGTRLLDWLTIHDLRDVSAAWGGEGKVFALAGSLGPRDLAALLPLRPDWFAVRGAACEGGHREGAIDPARVRDLVRRVNTVAIPAG